MIGFVLDEEKISVLFLSDHSLFLKRKYES